MGGFGIDLYLTGDFARKDSPRAGEIQEL